MATAPYPIDPADPLADAHALVSAWVEAAIASLNPQGLYGSVALESLPAGERLVKPDSQTARSAVLAAITQVRFWEEMIATIRLRTPDPGGQWEVGYTPEWYPAWGRTRQAAAVPHALLRRSLPFAEPDLIALVGWCSEDLTQPPNYEKPFAQTVQALKRFVNADSLGPALRAEMISFASRLQANPTTKVRQIGDQLGALVPLTPEIAAVSLPTQQITLARPTPAGDPRVLVTLKRYLGIPLGGEGPAGPVGEATRVGDDRFPLAPDSPLATEHGWLSEALEAQRSDPVRSYGRINLDDSRIGVFLRDQDPATRGRVVLAAAERRIHALIGPQPAGEDQQLYEGRMRAVQLFEPLAGLGFDLDRAGTVDFLLFLAATGRFGIEGTAPLIKQHVARFEAMTAGSPPTEGERFVLTLVRASMIDGPALGRDIAPTQALTRIIGDGLSFLLAPSEVWSDAANVELTAEPPERREKWVALLSHALTASAARPSPKWLAEARKRVEAIGGEAVASALGRWFGFVSRGRVVPMVRWSTHVNAGGDLMADGNANALKGLLWLAPVLPGADSLVRAIGAVAQSAYRKVPGIGPRAVKVGNAAVAALASIGSPGAVGQLALLKVKVKFGTAQKEIAKAFDTAAKALDLPRDEIEELGVPSYSLEEVGRRVEALGDARAELVVTGTDAALRWFDAKSKTLKSVPAAAKRDHKDEVKELQDAVKDIAAMLPTQRDRIDGLFLLRRSWPIDAWRERYADHPLVGTIARRLIWRVDGRAALGQDGMLTDVTGEPLAVREDSQVTVWHPVECPTSEVLAWRERLEVLGITQPFKQAHREVYILTDAERRTATYSNRFAGHVVRQHQFHALCGARGWKNQLRLMVDQSYAPPSKELPAWGLRAEYWVEGIGNDYGTDTNESGSYLRLATDQVRFYRTGAATNWAHAAGGRYESEAHGPGTNNINEPVPLDQIPALVLSEVMRDVDLFVGVASVGNDPTWQDGGPGGRYREYWQSYSFGELSGTATTRRAVLERLVPRLKIAKRCSFTDRFLRVEGSKRAYKIHLGSGNILMEPNDQYLCIVPDASARKQGAGDLFLPFEGDAMLSVILSKAFLLADDAKITDPTITRQIDGH